MTVDIPSDVTTSEVLELLFAEELGWLLEVTNENEAFVLEQFKAANVSCKKIGVCDAFGMNAKVSSSDGLGIVNHLVDKLRNSSQFLWS